MISTFNLAKLQNLLQDFYTMTQIRITVFDESFHELVAYPKDIASFCKIIRTDPIAEKKCHECDKQAFQHTAKHNEMHLYKCHAGLTECVAPIHLNNLVIGYLVFGHVFSYNTHDEGWKIIKELCKPYYLNMDKLKDACYDRPIISDGYITSASHILQAVASYLCLEQMAVLRHNELPVQIDQYISEHFTEDINASSLCNHFNIGKTQLYQITNQCYGKGVAEHIRTLRLDKAKHMLITSPELRISEISDVCGFNDYNYFITMFKRENGISPRAFRVANKKNE